MRVYREQFASRGRMTIMPDRVTVINLVWMTTMSALLATTIFLYSDSANSANSYGPPITARYHSFGH